MSIEDTQAYQVFSARSSQLHEMVVDTVDAAEAVTEAYERDDLHDALNRAAIALLCSEMADADNIDLETAMTIIIRELLDFVEVGDADLGRLANEFYDTAESATPDQIVESWDRE